MRSARKVWNLTMSAPASAAASTSARARASEPSWLTPASAMTRTRPLISSTGKLDKALPRERTKIAEAAQSLDDAARHIARAIGVFDGRLVALERGADGVGDGASLGRAGDDRGGFEPPLLAVADVD